MRAKNFLLILCFVVVTSVIYLAFNSTGEPNDSFKSIVTQTHEQFNKLQETLRAAEQKKFDIDPEYLSILGFVDSPLPPKEYQQQVQYQKQEQEGNGDINTLSAVGLQTQSDTNHNYQQQQQQQQSILRIPATDVQNVAATRVTNTPYNATKANFTIVTYAQDGQGPSIILLSQNIASKFPNEYLLVYDLGLSEEEGRALAAYCNSTKCSVISYDLSIFPSHITNPRMHAYRPLVIKDALLRSKSILFAENYMRFGGTSRDLYELQIKAGDGVLGWSTSTAVSTRTHPKMFNYFQTEADDFHFLRMVDLDVVFFSDSAFVTQNIMLPWIKCALTIECIDPIGAQSNGCKYNKKPQYRYSGCHAYDTSAFNIVLGLTWHLDESKYSLPSDGNTLFYKETLEQATKILENRRRNSSETSEHPFLVTEE